MVRAGKGCAMNEFVQGNLKVGESSDATGSEPGDLTRLLAARMVLPESVADPLLSTMSLQVDPVVQEAADPADMRDPENTAGLHLQFDAAPRPALAAAVSSGMADDDLLSELIQSLSVADAASIRVTVPTRASFPGQEPSIDPSIATTTLGTVVDVSPASQAKTPPRKQRVSPDGEATTQDILVAGIIDSGAVGKFAAKSSILRWQGGIARLFATSDSEPRRPRDWREVMEAVLPAGSRRPKTADGVPMSSVAAPKFSASAGVMTELLDALQGSADSAACAEPEPPVEAPGECKRIVRASRSGEESLRGAPQSPPTVVAEAQPAVAPSPLASRFVSVLLLAIVVLLLANLVAILFLTKR